MKRTVTLATFLKSLRTLLPAFMREANGVLLDTANNIRDRMNVPGDPVTYPINWDSERQKQAFFASNGFGNGIPYERQGNMEQAFDVSQSAFGQVNLFAPHPAGAVFGSPRHSFWQSRIHRGRWTPLFDVYLEEVFKIPQNLLSRFRTVVGGL